LKFIPLFAIIFSLKQSGIDTLFIYLHPNQSKKVGKPTG